MYTGSAQSGDAAPDPGVPGDTSAAGTRSPGAVPSCVADALRMARAAADYLNSPAAVGIDGAACGEVLTALAGVRSRLAAAQATFLRKFDAAGAHDADGHASSSSWLAARAGMSSRAARSAVR